jgi:MIP family channel proteins
MASIASRFSFLFELFREPLYDEDVPYRTQWRKVAAEFIGTLIFIYVVCASVVVPTAYLAAAPGVAVIITAVAQGLALVSIVSMFDGVSGSHFNPAITLTLIIVRSVPPLLGLAYMIAQVVGAVVGAALLRASMPAWPTGHLGAPGLGVGISVGQAFFIEFLITSILLFVVVCSASDLETALAPIPIGFAVLAGVLIAKPLTGASMNPARAFGPSLVANWWDHHWVYWIAPLASSLLVAVIYKTVLSSVKLPERRPDPETV